MGMFVEGVWQDDEKQRTDKSGAFQRPTTSFRNYITADGSTGPTGEGGFPAEAGRYHLYVSLACPWAHRTLIFRTLKKLEDVISVSVVSPDMGASGWTFDTTSGSTGDDLYDVVRHVLIHEIGHHFGFSDDDMERIENQD